MQVRGEKMHKITLVMSVEFNDQCLMLCHLLLCSGLDGLMSILESFPAGGPFLTVAKTRRAW